MGTLKKASNPMSHKQLPSKNKGTFNKKHVILKSVPRQVKKTTNWSLLPNRQNKTLATEGHSISFPKVPATKGLTPIPSQGTWLPSVS